MAETELPAYALSLRRHDPDRFFTALFAPPDRRDRLFLLYALNHELARAREAAREPMLALIRLQWWREVVEGEPKRHELATPLHAAIAAGRISAPDLLTMILGREAEAEPSIPTLPAFRDYVDRTAGMLAVAAGRALGAAESRLARMRALGTAYGIAGHIRNVAALARQDRCLLPEDLLGAHGLTIQEVIAQPGATALRPVLRALAAEGRRFYEAGRGAFPRREIAAALPGVFARADLKRLEPAARARGVSDRLRVMAAGCLARV